jgi:hypothetical protein
MVETFSLFLLTSLNNPKLKFVLESRVDVVG